MDTRTREKSEKKQKLIKHEQIAFLNTKRGKNNKLYKSPQNLLFWLKIKAEVLRQVIQRIRRLRNLIGQLFNDITIGIENIHQFRNLEASLSSRIEYLDRRQDRIEQIVRLINKWIHYQCVLSQIRTLKNNIHWVLTGGSIHSLKSSPSYANHWFWVPNQEFASFGPETNSMHFWTIELGEAGVSLRWAYTKRSNREEQTHTAANRDI